MRRFKIVVNNNEYEVEVEERLEKSETGIEPKKISVPEKKIVEKAVEISKTKEITEVTTSGNETITAPLPGSILELKVKVGDKVEKGTILLILEAMKMENEIRAPFEATISEIRVKQGESVNVGEVLVILA